MCAVVRLRALMAQQAARLITNHPIGVKRFVLHIKVRVGRWSKTNIMKLTFSCFL
jgi:hypothetical protein